MKSLLLAGAVKNKFLENKFFCYFLGVFIIAEFIVCPIGDFPLNDDWSYAKAVIVFNEKAEFNFGIWPAMTLASHILWGSLFTKLFGFSHFILRFSTLVSALISAIVMYKMTLKISNNKRLATLACAFLLFNPVYFSLANTYMTDVNFCTLTMLCFYFIYQFHATGKLWYAFLVFLFSGLLVLVRQFGVVMPVCFIISCFFSPDRTINKVLIAMLVMAGVMAILKIYEGYLQRILPDNPTYKFSGEVSLLKRVFWDTFFLGFKDKFCSVLLQVLIYISPLALLPLPGLIKRSGFMKTSVTAILAAALAWFVFSKEEFPFHNIFTNMKLGPEVFYQSLHNQPHNVSDVFVKIMNVLKILAPSVSLWVIFLLILNAKTNILRRKINPVVICLVLVALGYSFMLFITESYFDRYVLPLVLTGLLLFSYFVREWRFSFSLALLPLCVMVYMAVSGTKDYFEWNEKRWAAYRFLNERCKIPHRLINGGFETSCWTDEGYLISYSYLDIESVNFVIQFDKPQENFKLLAEYPFQRYFPYKKDKMNIFVREGNIKLYDKPSSKKR
ncbi:MAG: glycosyltransferase family 39 protein [Bacteroidetes bacterium]|nr:glycosyltransferase family 39 protein [Bacteroidota bacterium]